MKNVSYFYFKKNKQTLKELFGQLSRHLEFRNGKIYFFAGSKKGFKFGF